MKTPVTMTQVEWDLIKQRFDDMALSQKAIVDAVKELHDCVDDTKEQVKDVKGSVEDLQQMILNAVPNGDMFRHKLDHVEIGETRDLKKVGKTKMVEYAVVTSLGVVVAAIGFYAKFGV